MTEPPSWLRWAQQIQAIAQTGLTYNENEFDIDRYNALQRIAAEMLGAYTETGPERFLRLFGMDSGYATPKIDVRGVVFRDEELLLVRERSTGKWTLPGGFAEVGDSPRDAVEREVREESGYRVGATRLLALYDRDRHPHTPAVFACYKVFIECELLGGKASNSLETTEVGFFPRTALPEIDTARVTAGQIERVWALHEHAGCAAEFD